MKKIAGLLLCGGFLFNSLSTWAQSYADQALLFSRTSAGGSARIQGMGGAQVSLGGDYSSAFSNPGGLGMFSHSEFTFTPGLTSTSTSSTYGSPSLGPALQSSQSTGIIPGFSLVIHKKKDNGILLGGTFGLSFNRTNDFNRTITYGGLNPNTSIIDYFVADANSYGGYPSQLFSPGGPLYDAPTGLAWANYLINPKSASDSLHYGTDVTGKPTQHEIVQTTGGQKQLNFSYGVNLADKVFLGGGIGLAFLNYKRTNTYTESFSVDPLSSLALLENYSTTATGINATFGGIYKPIDFIQVGISWTTPTYYFSVHDNYDATMSTIWSNFPYSSPTVTAPSGPISTDELPYDYMLQTPGRLNVGVTYFVQQHGFISGDIEYLNYANNHYTPQSDDGSFDYDNQAIKSLYRSVLNYRVGGEYRLGKFRVRAGYNFKPDPYKGGASNEFYKIQSFSAGTGYRAAKFSIDIAAIYSQGNTTYFPYINSSISSPMVTTQNTNTTVMVTVGVPLKTRSR